MEGGVLGQADGGLACSVYSLQGRGGWTYVLGDEMPVDHTATGQDFP